MINLKTHLMPDRYRNPFLFRKDDKSSSKTGISADSTQECPAFNQFQHKVNLVNFHQLKALILNYRS